MEADRPSPAEIIRWALLLEGGLAAAAWLIGILCGVSPFRTLSTDSFADFGGQVLRGVAATVPLLALLLVSVRLKWPPLVRLKRLVNDQLVPLFRDVSVAGLALIAATAGWGEELLFRGLLQEGLAETFDFPAGRWIAVGIAAAAFGAAHLITPLYGLLATLVGVYLGWLFLTTERLLVPMVAHGLYDFLALLYLVHWQTPPGTKKGDPI